MPLINCEINLILTWSADCVIFSTTRATKFTTTDTKFDVLFVTLLNQDLKEYLIGININQKHQ